MQINVNTDNTIEKHQGLDEHVATVVQSSIGASDPNSDDDCQER